MSDEIQTLSDHARALVAHMPIENPEDREQRQLKLIEGFTPLVNNGIIARVRPTTRFSLLCERITELEWTRQRNG
jgi:hypothetical protein